MIRKGLHDSEKTEVEHERRLYKRRRRLLDSEAFPWCTRALRASYGGRTSAMARLSAVQLFSPLGE